MIPCSATSATEELSRLSYLGRGPRARLLKVGRAGIAPDNALSRILGHPSDTRGATARVSEVRFQGIVEPHQSHLRVHGGSEAWSSFSFMDRGAVAVLVAPVARAVEMRRGKEEMIRQVVSSRSSDQLPGRRHSQPHCWVHRRSAAPPLLRDSGARRGSATVGSLRGQRPLRPEAAAGGTARWPRTTTRQQP